MLASLIFALLALPNAVQEAETEAQKALTAGNRLEALESYEAALRAADDTATKARLRDAYRAVEWVEPPPVRFKEWQTVATHILNERVRIYAAAADRFQRGKMPHAAIILRREIIRLTGSGSKRGKEETGRIQRIVDQMTEKPGEADKQAVSKLMETTRDGPGLIRAARKLLEQRRFKAVVLLSKEMQYGTYDPAIKQEAIEVRKEAERIAAVDLTTDEKQEARKVLLDERFDRLDVARSRHFLFIGPKIFVDAIKPEERTLLDLAYIYQSDLAAQPLTANGERICVYYQETFDFGGGLAGGKLIRIGNRAIRPPIAGMLHYHELGHCIFGRGWLHPGFTEGLADFAAGFSLDALGQTIQAQQFIVAARDQFVRYFLGRDVRYFDIQSYRPSAGFLFSFLPPGEAPFDWTPHRRAFHRMREAQFGNWPERQHQIMRFFGYLMAAEYGPAVFETLKEWGWPVSQRDWFDVPDDARDLLSEVKQGDFALSKGNPHGARNHYEAVLSARDHGHVADRARFGLMRVALQQGDNPAAEDLKRQLGILDAFLVCGPFHARRQTAHVVFPPETAPRLALGEQVIYDKSVCIWKRAKVRPDGYVDLKKQGYGYPEHACAFAVTYVQVDRPTSARIWLGSDDGHTLFVNGNLIEKRATQRAVRFDDDFGDADLSAGWNRILIKVHNSAGEWGFLARITDLEGKPLSGLRVSNDDHEAALDPFEVGKPKTTVLAQDEFKNLSSSRWLTAVGKFDTQNGRLRPLGTAKIGLWQRFKVDPDKPKDGPANILWLRAPALAGADSIQAELVLPGNGKALPGKFGLTIDGENENDGQSGHTFVIDRADDKLRCHWYRYDQLLYLQQGIKVKPAESYRVVLRRIGSKWWLTVNGVALFERVDAPRLPAFGVGLLTWGRGPDIESFRLLRVE